MYYFIKIIGSLFLIFLLVGCTSSYAVRYAQAALKAKITPLIGKTEREVILELGAPSKIEDVKDLRIFKYFRSYGYSSSGYANSNSYGSSAFSNTYESYDSFDLFFENGIFVKWKGYVQR